MAWFGLRKDPNIQFGNLIRGNVNEYARDISKSLANMKNESRFIGTHEGDEAFLKTLTDSINTMHTFTEHLESADYFLKNYPDDSLKKIRAIKEILADSLKLSLQMVKTKQFKEDKVKTLIALLEQVMQQLNALNLKKYAMEYLDKGADSQVYIFNDKIIKSYHGRKDLSSKEMYNLIKKYVSNTQKASRIIEEYCYSNISKMPSILINNEKYAVLWRVVPQGNTQIIGENILSVGQEYIGGDNLSQRLLLPILKDHKSTENIINKELKENSQAIKKIRTELTELVNLKLGTNFFIDFKNVKVLTDIKSKKVYLMITDLGDTLLRGK